MEARRHAMKLLLVTGAIWTALAAPAAIAAPPAPPPPPITGGVRAQPGFQYPYGDLYRQAPVRRYDQPYSRLPGRPAVGDQSRRYPLGGPDNDSVGSGSADRNPVGSGAANRSAASSRSPSGTMSHRWYW